jgi:hypothetical protein
VESRSAEYVDLRKLMVWDVEAIWTEWLALGTEQDRELQLKKLQCAYAESWALVHFLCHADEGKFRPLFLDYFQSELQGQGGWDEFTRLLNRHHPTLDLLQLQVQFKDYIKKL